MQGTSTVRVLLIEKEDLWCKILAGELKGYPFEIINAPNVEQARRLFSTSQGINIVVITDFVSGNKNEVDCGILALIKEIRKSFSGPIVASSSNCNYRSALVKSGCDHETIKSHLPKKLLELSGSL